MFSNPTEFGVANTLITPPPPPPPNITKRRHLLRSRISHRLAERTIATVPTRGGLGFSLGHIAPKGIYLQEIPTTTTRKIPFWPEILFLFNVQSTLQTDPILQDRVGANRRRHLLAGRRSHRLAERTIASAMGRVRVALGYWRLRTPLSVAVSRHLSVRGQKLAVLVQVRAHIAPDAP